MAEAAEAPSETVMVVVRMRPFNTKEKNENRGPCIELDYKRKTVSITLMTEGKAVGPPQCYTYDSVHGEDTVQMDFYNTACRGLVNAVLSGFNGTIFAYGQTGCGKTWTMAGVLTVPHLRGVIPNSFDHIWEHVRSKPTTKFLVRCSYLEIYNENVMDLLGVDTKAKLDLKESPDRGVFVQGLLEEVVTDVENMNVVMERGEKHRTVGATAMNAGSSRSHSIYSVVVEEYGEGEDGKDHLRAGKLNLVDLAGSETVAKTGATGDRMKEGVNINKSLSALGNVISALVAGGGKHIPYRDSKLTRLLQSSLGGNTKTLMMAAISPADYNYNETLSTLRYAARAKNIKNKAKINEDPKDAMLREYKEEIDRLKAMLAAANGGVMPTAPIATASAEAALSARIAAPVRKLSKDDLSDDDMAAREGEGDCEPDVISFLDAEGLGQFAGKFAAKGVTSMEQLTAPWLRVAEGFLMDKVGMASLDVTRFQTAVELKEKGVTAPQRLASKMVESLDDLELDGDLSLDDEEGGGEAKKVAPKRKKSAKKAAAAEEEEEEEAEEGAEEEEAAVALEAGSVSPGDTVTFATLSVMGRKRVVVGQVLDVLDGGGLTVWDGSTEVSCALGDVTRLVKAPPRRPGMLSGADSVRSAGASQDLEMLSDFGSTDYATAGTAQGHGTLKAPKRRSSKAPGADPAAPALSPAEALEAQQKAAKDFMESTDKQKDLPRGRSSDRYEEEGTGEGAAAAGGKGGKGKGKGGKGVKPKSRAGSPTDARGRSSDRYEGEGVMAEGGEEGDNEGEASGGKGKGKGKGVRPKSNPKTRPGASPAKGRGTSPAKRRGSKGASESEDEASAGWTDEAGEWHANDQSESDWAADGQSDGAADSKGKGGKGGKGAGRGKGPPPVKGRKKKGASDGEGSEDRVSVDEAWAGDDEGKVDTEDNPGTAPGASFSRQSSLSAVAGVDSAAVAAYVRPAAWVPAKEGGPPDASPGDVMCVCCGNALTKKTKVLCVACGHGCCLACTAKGPMPLPQFRLGTPQVCCGLCVEIERNKMKVEGWVAGSGGAEEVIRKYEEAQAEKEVSAMKAAMRQAQARRIAAETSEAVAEYDEETKKAELSNLSNNMKKAMADFEARQAAVKEPNGRPLVAHVNGVAAPGPTDPDRVLPKSSLVDGTTGKDISFVDVFFEGDFDRDEEDTKEGTTEVGSSTVAAKLKAVTAKKKALQADLKVHDAGLVGLIGLRLKEKEAARAIVMAELAAVIGQLTELEGSLAKEGGESKTQRTGVTPIKVGAPMPPVWERGVSLALLDKFANECVVEDSSTEELMAFIRPKLAACGNRTALYGLLRDVGLRTVVTRAVQLMTDDGVPYDNGDEGEIEEVEIVVSAVGPPNMYLAHSWSQSFRDAIDAAVHWSRGQGLDPASVYVWMDTFCINQWTEVTHAVGASGKEHAIAEGFVFAIRACGNTLILGSPGFGVPVALERLWCAMEIYVTVCVGAQCFFVMPPRDMELLETLVTSELPILIKHVVHGFDGKLCKSSYAADQNLLMKYIRNGHKPWGIEPSKDLVFFNRCVASAIRSFLTQVARRVISRNKIGGGDGLLSASADGDGIVDEDGVAQAASGGGLGSKGDAKELPLMSGFALILEEQGRAGVGGGKGWAFKMAVIWFLKVIKTIEQVRGPEHPLMCRMNLHIAALLKLQGKREEAAPRYLRCVESLYLCLVKPKRYNDVERAQGRTLVCAARCDLALVLRDMGRLEHAIECFKKARKDLAGDFSEEEAKDDGKTFNDQDGDGEEDIDTDEDLDGDGQDDYDKHTLDILRAEARQVLGLESRGGDEGLLYESLIGMAAVRILQGQHEAALVMFEEALEEQESILGDGHPATLNTIQCCAALKARCLLPMQDAMVVDEFEKTLRVYEVVFGSTHPHTISVVLQLGAAFARASNSKDALKCYARALSEYATDEAMVLEEAEAKDHFLSDGAFKGVAEANKEENKSVAVQQQKSRTDQHFRRKSEAEVAVTSTAGDHYDLLTLRASKDTGGQYSPLDTAACVNNMAVEFRKLGLLNEAAESFARALHIKERELGEFHPSVAKVMNNYALIRWRMGHLDTALKLFQRLIVLYETLSDASARVAAGEDPCKALGLASDFSPSDAMSLSQAAFGQARRTAELNAAKQLLAEGVPREDIAMALAHIALVHQQLGNATQSMGHFSEALELREAMNRDTAAKVELAIRQGQGVDKKLLHSARASQAACASTLYNRGLLFQQAGDLLSAGADLRRALVASRESMGAHHEYTSDSAAALAFVGRSLAALVAKSQASNPRHPDNAFNKGIDGRPIRGKGLGGKDVKEGGAPQLTYSVGSHTEFEFARYEAHRDECLSCYDTLCTHWKVCKGRGHPACVAALNAIAEVYKWEGRREDALASYTRALREGNAKVDMRQEQLAEDHRNGAIAPTRGMGSRAESSQTMLIMSLGETTPEAAAAAAAADEMEARITFLRDEKQAAVAREDYKQANALKQEILDLQLRIIEMEEKSTGRDIPMNAVGGGSGRRLTPAKQNSSFSLAAILGKEDAKKGGKGGGGHAEVTGGNSEGSGITSAKAEGITESWGSTQKLSQETILDQAVTNGWSSPEEDESSLRTRLETLKGMASSNFDKQRHEEVAAYHARVLKLTQKAVHDDVNGVWPLRAVIEPLVALAGAAFSLGHYPQSRTLYEQALQVTEKEMGANSPDTAAALNDLAIVVREVHEDQEALQLHARAIRIRQKAMGVWNVTVAETLYNVSLIYRDLGDLPSAIQCSRGCCRIYDAVLGPSAADTRDAEEHLDQLSDDFANGGALRPGYEQGGSFFSCGLFGGGGPPKLGNGPKEVEASHDLAANQRLRMAFRTVLEEVSRGAPAPHLLKAIRARGGSDAPNKLSDALKSADQEAIRSWTAGIGAHAMQGNSSGTAVQNVYSSKNDTTAVFQKEVDASEGLKRTAKYSSSNQESSVFAPHAEGGPPLDKQRSGASFSDGPPPPPMGGPRLGSGAHDPTGRGNSFNGAPPGPRLDPSQVFAPTTVKKGDSGGSSRSSSFSSQSSFSSSSTAVARTAAQQQAAQAAATAAFAAPSPPTAGGMGASAAQAKALSAFGGPKKSGAMAVFGAAAAAPAAAAPAGNGQTAAQKKALAAFGGGTKRAEGAPPKNPWQTTGVL